MTDIPRRNRVDRMSPAELAIYNTKMIVEETGCDPLLTEAVDLLAQAQDKVADFIDKTMERQAKGGE